MRVFGTPHAHLLIFTLGLPLWVASIYWATASLLRPRSAILEEWQHLQPPGGSDPISWQLYTLQSHVLKNELAMTLPTDWAVATLGLALLLTFLMPWSTLKSLHGVREGQEPEKKGV